MQKPIWTLIGAVSVVVMAATVNSASAQSSLTNQGGDQAIKEIERYRQALGDGNPAEL